MAKGTLHLWHPLTQMLQEKALLSKYHLTKMTSHNLDCCQESLNKSLQHWDRGKEVIFEKCCLQASETVSWCKLDTLLFQYGVTLSRGWGLIYICKVDHSKISRNFSRNWLGFNSLREIFWIMRWKVWESSNQTHAQTQQ